MKKSHLTLLLLLALSTQLSAQMYYYTGNRAPYLGDHRISLIGGLDYSFLSGATLTIDPSTSYHYAPEETFDATSMSMGIAPTIGLSYNGIQRENNIGMGFNTELTYTPTTINASFKNTPYGDYDITAHFTRLNFLVGYTLAYFLSDELDIYLGMQFEARNPSKGSYTLVSSKIGTLEGETPGNSFFKQFSASIVGDLGAHYYLNDHLAVGGSLRYAHMFNPSITLCDDIDNRLSISASSANRLNLIGFVTYIL